MEVNYPQVFIINVLSNYKQGTHVLKFGFKETQRNPRGVTGHIRLSSSTLVSRRRLKLPLMNSLNYSDFCHLPSALCPLPSALGPRQRSSSLVGKKTNKAKKGNLKMHAHREVNHTLKTDNLHYCRWIKEFLTDRCKQ